MKKVIAVILITIGIVVIVQAIGLKTYTKVKENQLINEFEDELEKKLDDKQEPLTSDPPTQEQVQEMKSLLGGEKLAIIEIPKIGVKSIIVEGTEMRHLKYYVGHFTQTKMPGEYGNFAISGHSSTVYTEVFNKVHTLKPDDLIKITTLFGEYDYYVKTTEMVNPYRYDVLNDEEGKRSLTIVTCNENGSMRLIVKAEMDEPLDEEYIEEGDLQEDDAID
ncbi:MAG: class D sortase [Andreesenia angusta]|nr:class D sortase [Andreesenia angusta]